MQIKIVRGLAVAMALGLTACSGSSSTSTSTTGATTTATTSSTTGSHSSSTGTTTTTTTTTTTSSTGGTSTGGTTSTIGTSTTGSHSSSTGTSTTGSHSSSTGTSGTGSTGTPTGSTGTSGSTGGNTDTDCGTAHSVCADGTYCQPFGGGQTGLPTVYVCACSSADSRTSAPDSCREANDVPGGNGLVVCDDNTGSCRAPRDYEEIFEYGTEATFCAPGFTFLHFVVSRPDGGVSGEDLPDGGLAPDYADGGYNFGCLELCDHNDLTNHACSANFTACEAGALSGPLPDGGSGAIDACVENDCGDLLYNAPDGGTYTVDAGPFYGACTTDRGPGTGFCSPLPNTNGSYGAVCFATGTAAINTPCDGFFGLVNSTTNCAANEICLGSGFPNVTFTTSQGTATIASAYCFETCNSADTNFTCAPINGQAAACNPFNGDPSQTENPDYQYGYCQ